jgi:curved DNA-binding protein CbpA
VTRLFLILTFLLSFPLRAAERFELVDGVNFYQILGVEQNETLAAIKIAHRKLIKKAHPDSGGSDVLAKKINHAFDIIKTRRAEYDYWLQAGGPTSSSSLKKQSEEDVRKVVLETMVSELAEHMKNVDRFASPQEIANIARMTIVYNQRFLTGASLQPEDLMYLINAYTLSEEAYERFGRDSMYALGYGAITLLQEGQSWEMNGAYSFQLRELRELLERIITKFDHRDWWAQMADALYQFMEGRSFIVEMQNRHREASHRYQQASSCEPSLQSAVRTKDENGVEWVIPITINIKLGP